MISPIYTETVQLPPVCRREVLRYAGVKEETPELSGLLREALQEAEPYVSGKVCWREFPITWQENTIDLGFVQTDSTSLRKNLAGCERIVVFAATLGLSFDRLISRCSQRSPAKALMLQAIGAERVEALCDVFCERTRAEAEQAGMGTAPRFSPGYGDFPLSAQQDFFRVLDCSQKIGLTLNESLLMSPSKSVTAIIGIGSQAVCRHSGCAGCGKTDCAYRRTL